MDVVKASVWVKPNLLERARNTVAFVAEETHGFTFVKLLDDALTREITRLERKYRAGRAFPQRAEKGLKPGARTKRPAQKQIQLQRTRVAPESRVSCAPVR